jgi:peptide/nickel transport system permease protein
MKKQIGYKLAYIFCMFWAISAISFLIVHIAPNSFLASGELNPNITAEALENLKKIYGLEKPLLEQYLIWCKSIIGLDFGISFSSGKSVKDEILVRLPITLTINLISMFFIFAISLFVGVLSGLRQGSKLDSWTKNFSALSFAMPSFYLAILLIGFFSIYLGVLPISGLHSEEMKEPSGLVYWSDYAKHLILPLSVIILTGVGSMVLYVRSLSVEILKSDYLFFAKARGASSSRVVFSYILPNLSPAMITMLGMSLPAVIGGSVLIESIFAINGMGLLFFQAALSRDYPVILGITMTGAFLTLLGNIIADLVLLRLNPFISKSD